MDENYKEPDLSKVVKQLMDEEGYEFGEAVKEAMAQGYKDGGLMVAIQRFNQGGMAGNKTYHQFHDQYVPMDEESMGYANGGGIGSMMQPKKNKEEPVVQGGVDNYLGKQPQVQAPRKWQSSPNKPATELAYITEAEKDLILKANIHGGLEGGPNMGPSGIMSLDSFGDVGGGGAGGADTDAGGGYNTGAGGGGFSGQNTNTTSDREFDRQKANQRAALQIAERQQAKNLGIAERTNIANRTYGPLQKYTGERGFFGNLLRGANKYGYTDTYTDGPNAGEVKSGYAGRVFGGLLGLLTGIPGVGSIIGNQMDRFKSKPKDMTEFNRLGLFGTPPGTFDFDPNAPINPDVDTTGYSRFSNKSLGIMNPNITAPPSKPDVIGFNEDIDVGYNDPAFENDLMAKLNKIEQRTYDNLKTGKELNMNTPEMNKQLEQLEQKKNEAALNTTMFS